MTNQEQPHQPNGESPGAITPEQQEVQPRDGPHVYVASLSDYNAGILHGQWIEATEDVEDMQDQIDDMLAGSTMLSRYGEVAEEWAIHDYEGFGGLLLDEHEPLSTVALLAGGLQEYGPAFAAWADHVGTRDIDELERFEETYRGEWDSVEQYAEELLEGVDEIIDKAPDWLQPYITVDFEGFARDLELGGDVTSIDKPGGGVWIFSS